MNNGAHYKRDKDPLLRKVLSHGKISCCKAIGWKAGFLLLCLIFAFGVIYLIDLGKGRGSLKIKVIYLPHILVEQHFIRDTYYK